MGGIAWGGVLPEKVAYGRRIGWPGRLAWRVRPRLTPGRVTGFWPGSPGDGCVRPGPLGWEGGLAAWGVRSRADSWSVGRAGWWAKVTCLLGPLPGVVRKGRRVFGQLPFACCCAIKLSGVMVVGALPERKRYVKAVVCCSSGPCG